MSSGSPSAGPRRRPPRMRWPRRSWSFGGGSTTRRVGPEPCVRGSSASCADACSTPGAASTRQDSLSVRLAEVASEDLGQTALDPAAHIARVDLALAWRHLSPEEQEVLALTAFEDLTSPQAGQVLGISSTAYRLRLMRARRTLLRHLGPYREDAPTATSITALQENQT